jgi:hypothetical protein
MSRNTGSRVFRQVVNGSVVYVDIGLCEDIDYHFFGSGDSPITEGPDDNRTDSISAGEEKDEKKMKLSLKLMPSSDSKNSKNEHVCNGKITDVNNESHSSLQLDSADNLRAKRNLIVETESPKEDDHMDLKGLMNCIAYGESKNNDGDEDDDDDDHVISKVHSHSSDFLSLSTDTTSEITDVTTCPPSGCSSMSKHEPREHQSEEHHKDAEGKQQKCDKHADVTSGTSMKFLVNALDSFDKQKRKSLMSDISTGQKNRLGRKNMSFSNEQYRKIERENEILLKKLQILRRPRPKQLSPPTCPPRLPSSAINRRKQQTKIDHDNMASAPDYYLYS